MNNLIEHSNEPLDENVRMSTGAFRFLPMLSGTVNVLNKACFEAMLSLAVYISLAPCLCVSNIGV